METPIHAPPPPALKTPPQLTPAEQALVADMVADGLSIQEEFRPEPLCQKTGKGHYTCDTVKEIALTWRRPFPWQDALFKRFLENDLPTALDMPTGLGKTSVMAIWLITLGIRARVRASWFIPKFYHR